ncbi:MAG: glucuronate isomerase [Sphingobacteriales bacterium]
MKSFLDDEWFLLKSSTARELYHGSAKDQPIIDYHNHLSPQEMAENKAYANITQLWLKGDHYKWRAMRANGVPEELITGDADDRKKFQAWAQTVPYTWRNPLFHWTHLELKRYFGIDALLNGDNADRIYDEINEKLADPAFHARGLLEKMDVRILCTTDDPIDTLEHHQRVQQDNWQVKVYPAFRPDKAMAVDQSQSFLAYLGLLEKTADVSIVHYADYLKALAKRHQYFADHGCCISDHGLEEMYAETFSEQEIASIFEKLRVGKQATDLEQQKFKSAMLIKFAEWDWEKEFVQQYHLGPIRNNNTRAMHQLGPDTGWDSTGDLPQAKALAAFLDRLDSNNTLAKTILYNINPADNEVFATMIGNFNDGTYPGKIQWGSAWWFLDQKDGIVKQLDTLSNMGLLSRFVGMLTDSRSFLSFPRHEYFRRILCNLIGQEMEDGELPMDKAWAGKIIADICYQNALNYFNWSHAK